MKAAFLYGIKDLRISDIDERKPKEGEIAIRVLYSLTCGTDLKTYERGHPYIVYPRILGHEYVGEIIAKGEGVKDFEIGDIVAGANSAPCFDCFYCKRNKFNLCENLKDSLLGFTKDGSFSEYMIIPSKIVKTNLFRIEDKEYKKYAALEPLACVVHGWNLLGQQDFENVLIIGSGPIALLHAQMAKRRSKNVILIGKHEERLKKARELGIEVHDLEKEKEIDKKFELVIEAVGKQDAWEMAFNYVEKGSTVLFFGGLKYGSKVLFDAYKIHYEEIKLLGSFHHDPKSVKEAFELIRNGIINVPLLITSERRLEELKEALEDMAKGKEMKVGIIP